MPVKPRRGETQMKARLFLIACALFAPSLAFAQPLVSASDLENRFWQALQRNDLAALKSMMTPDYLSVEDGMSTRDQVIAYLSRCRLNRFALSHQHQQAISANAVTAIYRIREEATCGDKQYNSSYIATTIWVLRDGQWLAELHTEHPLDDKKQ
jgi:hypothetical protein